MSLENRPALSLGSKFKRGIEKASWRLKGIPGHFYDDYQEIKAQLESQQEAGVTTDSEEFKELSRRAWNWGREIYEHSEGLSPSQPTDASE